MTVNDNRPKERPTGAATKEAPMTSPAIFTPLVRDWLQLLINFQSSTAKEFACESSERYTKTNPTTLHHQHLHPQLLAAMPTPPPSNNVPAPSETGSDPTANWGSRYRGVCALPKPTS